MPIIFLGIFLVSIMSNNTETAINEFRNVLSGYIVTPIGLAVIIAITEFLTSMLYIAPTAISRDGINAVFMKYIPVSLYKQYIYKCIPNIIMNVVTIVICLAVAQYLLKLPIITIILLFIVATVIGTLQSIVMIIIDLKRPKLSWDSEYAVVKQNFNLIFPMIIGMINIAVLIFMVFLFKNINVYIGLFILGIIYTVAVFLTNKYLYKNQFKLADKIM